MDDVKDTCFSKCRHYKKRDRCADYMQTQWVKDDSAEVLVIHDCARRRTMLLMMNFEARMIGLQTSSEQERNASHNVAASLAQFAERNDIALILPHQSSDTKRIV